MRKIESLMCDCENMTGAVRDDKIALVFETVFQDRADEDGEVKWDQVLDILNSLGRKVGQDRVAKLRRKFDTDESGLVDYKDRNFLMAISSIGVADVNSIQNKVFTTAFKIFDTDEDNLLSLAEARIILSLFLPVRVQQEQELVETILYSMDSQKDGYIRQADLIAGVRTSTSFSLSLYREEFILAGLMVAGFLLYQVAKQYGLVPVIGVYDGPIGT